MAIPFALNIEEAVTTLMPLVQLVVGMVIYSILIFHFYRFLARRDPLDIDMSRYRESRHSFLNVLFKTIVYLFENILLVPLFTFLWFVVMTIIIAFMAKEQAAHTIIMVSMAFVATVRITAYYKEDLSMDLAKVLPITLLVIFITELSSFTYTNFFETLKAAVLNWKPLAYYFAFAVLLEIVLNVGYEVFSPPHRRKENKD